MALIELEIYIKNNIKNEISSDFYWLSNPLKFKKKLKKFFISEKKHYFMYLNEQSILNNIIPQKILSFGNLIKLEDEATYIAMTFNKIPLNIIDEITFFKTLSNCKNEYSVQKEIYFRFMAAYEQVYKHSNIPDELECVSRCFYRNEMNILFSRRWTFKYNFQNTKGKMWESYTEEYYWYYK